MKQEESQWRITWRGEEREGTYAALVELTKGYLGPVFEKIS